MTPGVVLDGKYRLMSPLGEGGMGSVWKAYDLRLDAPIAIKLMNVQTASSPDAYARFVREAKAAANLRSPHVVQVFDFGVDEGLRAPYLAMELLEGESLRERLARVGPLSALEVSRIVTHVARALLRAHDADIVHRDLKPANIFLVKNADSELAKVLDFGIAKWVTHPLSGVATHTGTFLGTPYYMSPEQISCSKNIDYRSDLWSLGVIAVECMTGRLPFSADNLPALALMISQNRPTPPSRLGRVPAGLDAWFAQATATQPSHRFTSAAEQAQALRASCEAEPVQMPRPIAEQRGTDPPPSSPSVGALSRTSSWGGIDRSRHLPSRSWKWLGAMLAVPPIVGALWFALRHRQLPTDVEVTTLSVPSESVPVGGHQPIALPAPTFPSTAAGASTQPAGSTAPKVAPLPQAPTSAIHVDPSGSDFEALPVESGRFEARRNKGMPAVQASSTTPKPIASGKATSKARNGVPPSQPKVAPRHAPAPAPNERTRQAVPPAEKDTPSAFDVPI